MPSASRTPVVRATLSWRVRSTNRMKPTRLLAMLALVATTAPARAEEPDDREQPSAVEMPAVERTEPGKRVPTGRFEVGAGFSSDEGFIAHAAIAQDDLFHTGQKLALSADISALRQRFLVSHEIPGPGSISAPSCSTGAAAIQGSRARGWEAR
jgi:hypothetical protein